jgi:hypothetical protein
MDSPRIEVPLLDGKWELDCFELAISNSATPPSQFSGNGFISQNEMGRLRFKMLACSNSHSSLDVFANNGEVPGQIVEADQYYRLTARDSHGYQWNAERLLIRNTAHFFGARSEQVIKGDIPELVLEADSYYATSVHSLRLVFFTVLELPSNAIRQTETRFAGELFSGESAANIAKFETDYGNFLIYQEEDRVIVKCEASRPFPPHFDVRINEAMSFLFARRLHWNISELHSDGHQLLRIRSERLADKKGFLPPIHITYRAAASESWKLYTSYLQFVCQWTDGTFHPCTRHLIPVYNTNNGSIEARALALSVNVEGLTRVLFPDSESKSNETKALVGRLRQHCVSWKEFDDPQTKNAWLNRVSGLLGQLLSPTPRDILRRLSAANAIEERLIGAWTKLRPKAAHANIWGSSDTQELVDLCASVRVLIHQLVFLVIGYEGVFTDYSCRGYPLKYFRGRTVNEDDVAKLAWRLWKADGEKLGNDWHYWFTAMARLGEGPVSALN